MASSTPKPRKFFKFLAPGFHKRLSIPEAFSESLSGRKLDKAIIESCQGSWHVKVGGNRHGALCFAEEGWMEFVKHHRLQVGEFLVFEHKGKMVFDVIVYESLGCEKEFPPPTGSPESTTRPSSSGQPLSSFRVMMSATHGCPKKAYVTIPKEFAKSTGLSDRSRVILRTAEKEWPVGLGTWQGAARDKPVCLRTALKTKGWHLFYKDNDLKDGDVCTFELKEMPNSRSQPVIMDVEFSRLITGSRS